MQKILVSIFAVAAMAFSTAGFSETGVGIAGAKSGYALDLTQSLTADSMVHGQLGMTDKVEGSDAPQRLFATADYDLIAPISKNVAVYAGLGLGDREARGAYARLPIGVMATFDRFPVRVAYEVANSLTLGADKADRQHFTDHSLAVSYLIK